MMSHCIVPDWNSRSKQRQEEIEGEDNQRNNTISTQVQQSPQNLSFIVPMSLNYEVGELAWDNHNKQPVPLHGHAGIQLPPQTKPTWSSTRTGDTLESLVQQATFNNTTQFRHRGDLVPTYSASIPTSSAGKWVLESSKSASSSGVKWRENSTHMDMGQNLVSTNLSTMTASSGGKWRENSSHMQVEQNYHGVKIGSMPTYSGGKRVENSSSGLVISKRIKSESKKHSGKNLFQLDERGSSGGGGGGASATFCKENTDTTMMTWASFESAPSMKTPRNVDDDSTYQDFSDEQFWNKEESARSQSSARRTTRAAVVHNQSERRRRDRINEKMKALQELVPNANKTDKASMLDEVIEYLKQLQAQVQMLSNARAMPQMLMPLGMQQQLQMSILGRMGIGMGMGPVGMGIVDVNNFPRNMPQPFTPLLHGTTPLSTTPSFVSPPFYVPSLAPPLTHLKAKANADINRNMPDFNDSNFGTFLAQQSMNMDFYNRMASLCRQQAIQPSKKPDGLSRHNNVQGD
ncbi:uncharacterized protein LOC142530112 isoform X1 [Primulina tabacum]|uniref:uncharacterized protein LOC142530112 isoform X1 n=1 Tax=Primulina tabacum TaxID=48773 RepID=UPI003F5A4714